MHETFNLRKRIQNPEIDIVASCPAHFAYLHAFISFFVNEPDRVGQKLEKTKKPMTNLEG